MKKAEYRVVTGENGFSALEAKVTKMLNAGWKTIGGIAFNSGFAYQAMARVVTAETEKTQVTNQTQAETKIQKQNAGPLGAIAAMKAVDEMT